jgi:hypothetical protein
MGWAGIARPFLIMNESEERVLRKTYSEIISGYSMLRQGGDIIYIKHPSPLTNLEIDFLYIDFFEEAKRRGIHTENDRLKILERDGLWGKKDADEVTSLENQIKDQYALKRKSYKLSEIRSIKEDIDKNVEKLTILLNKREGLIGITAEKYAKRNIDTHYIFLSFFKDRELKIPFFTKESFDELDREEVAALFESYGKANQSLGDDGIKKIAISEFFLNSYYLADNIHSFFGKPIAELTFHQTRLCAYGNFFKKILSSDPAPPDEVSKDPDKLEDWYNGRSNVEDALSKMGEDADPSTLVGLTNEDRKFLGYEEVKPASRNDMFNGRAELSMEEIMKLEGII